MGWFESPQYMKNIQKIRAMSPEDKAVNQVLINELHSLYADADMRKQLSAMHQATIDKARERDLELSQGRLDLSRELGNERLGLAQNEYDFQKDQNRTAEALGYGNIALSGLRGYIDMRNRKKLSGQIQSLIDKY